MLHLCRKTVPSATHLLGDMRNVRLPHGARWFDAVLVHDAICHLTTQAEVHAMIATAKHHLRPGGVIYLQPDLLAETFEEVVEPIHRERGVRTMNGTSWTWDPDPDDTTYRTDYAVFLRDGGKLTLHHETHIEGLFSTGTWLSALRAAGFAPTAVQEGVP